MSNRCPECNKFASLTLNEDPEVDLDIEGITVKATIRLVCESECCSDEVKEANLEITADDLDPSCFEEHIDPKTLESVRCEDHWHCDPTLAAHTCDGPDRTKPCPKCGTEPGDDQDDEHELEVEQEDVTVTDREEKRRTFYNVAVSYSVRCSCQAPNADPLFEGTLEEEVAADEMEDCA